jgi:sulfatase modifying factor 1
MAACSLEDLDLEGKACPCTDGYHCDTRTRLCVRGRLPETGSEVQIPLPDGGEYTIDALEVTVRAYKTFLDSKPDSAAQPAICAFNTSFSPEAHPSTGCPLADEWEAFPERPIVCVDWCDAYAYCSWKKQRLCGRIGGGSLTASERNDANSSQWFRACTRAGERAYPYGSVFEPRCNVESAGTPLDITHTASCEGGYAGLFNMSGNVAEWEDSCDFGGSPGCHVARRGGSFSGIGDLARCDSGDTLLLRSEVSIELGFRCCRG